MKKNVRIYFKNFKYRRALEVICAEMPEVLKVYVLLDCKLSFRCFDCVAVLSVNCGCNITPARGTKNFGIEVLCSGNRCKFTSMFSCASCQRCQRTNEILSAPNSPYHASVIDEPCSSAVKHWKDYFYRHKQNIPFRTTVFRCKLPIPFYSKNFERKIYLFAIVQKIFYKRRLSYGK